MIETGLVYIYSLKPTRRFVGCGALVEGGYIATCRHVWRMATQGAAAQGDEPPEVEIEYPRSREQGGTVRRQARLLDACEGVEEPPPDLVLLLPHEIPSGLMTLQLASHDRFEVGAGYAHAGLIGRDTRDRSLVRDVRVKGTIADHKDASGVRQFTGTNIQGYWSERGSSGSPIFVDGGQQLAGILSLSEVGANQGRSPLHEAFVLPATTILSYVRRLAARPVATNTGINPADLKPILDRLGAQDVPVSEIPGRLKQFVEAALTRAAEPVQPSNEGADIEAAIRASRAKLSAFDTTGARELLQAKIDEEQEARVRRLVPLLKERAEVERLAFDHGAAKATLTDVTRLAPGDVWAWIDLGDLWRIAGTGGDSSQLDNAANAYRSAEAAARRKDDDRGLMVSRSRRWDVLLAQGDSSGALVGFRNALTIAEEFARGDPGNTDWQRDLSVSHERIGDVLRDQGDGAGALAAYRAGLAIRETLARRDPANTEWQRDLSVSHDGIGDILRVQGDGAGALAAYRAGLAIGETLARRDPANTHWQRDLSVSQNKIGDVLMAQGDGAGALAAYRAGLAIRETLAPRDPANTQWERDLSPSRFLR